MFPSTYDVSQATEKFSLECSKCMIKGFQLLGNFMLIIIIESSEYTFIFNRLIQPELNNHFPDLKKKQMAKGSILQIPTLFLASPPLGLEPSPSPFMTTTGRAHLASGTVAASHRQGANHFLFLSAEAHVKNLHHRTGKKTIRLPLTSAADSQRVRWQERGP